MSAGVLLTAGLQPSSLKKEPDWWFCSAELIRRHENASAVVCDELKVRSTTTPGAVGSHTSVCKVVEKFVAGNPHWRMKKPNTWHLTLTLNSPLNFLLGPHRLHECSRWIHTSVAHVHQRGVSCHKHPQINTKHFYFTASWTTTRSCRYTAAQTNKQTRSVLSGADNSQKVSVKCSSCSPEGDQEIRWSQETESADADADELWALDVRQQERRKRVRFHHRSDQPCHCHYGNCLVCHYRNATSQLPGTGGRFQIAQIRLAL